MSDNILFCSWLISLPIIGVSSSLFHKRYFSADAPSYCPDVPNKADSTFTIESTCYHLVQNPNSPATRDFARSDCQSRKGRLLTIKTDQIQRNIKNAINRMSDSHTVLLGLMKESYQWKWMDGKNTNLTYTHPRIYSHRFFMSHFLAVNKGLDSRFLMHIQILAIHKTPNLDVLLILTHWHLITWKLSHHE